MIAIKGKFIKGPNVVMNGLVLYLDAANTKSYPGSGTVWTDLTNKSNLGTLQNGPTFDINNSGSLVLDGVNDRVLINCASNTIRSYDTTVFFTVKLPLYSGGQRCILSYRGSSGGRLYIGKKGSGIFTYYDELNTQAYTVGSIVDNTIAMCAVVINATSGSISHWINGSLAGTATGRIGFISSYNTAMYLGFDAGGTDEYMVGNFYSFMHYNRVLSSSEISQNFSAMRSRFSI